MFTGIIQDIGVVEEIQRNTNSLRMTISTQLQSEHLALGASVSCNGCCLTVVQAYENKFVVDIGPETLALTRFSQIQIGDRLNLEPALRLGDALGGHQVSGHVDGVFDIKSFEKLNNEFWKLSLLIPKNLSKYITLKGSISIVGISLTIANISNVPNDLVCVDFMIIPHTFSNTILQFISAKFNSVEVEFDQSTKTIASLFEGMIFN